MGCVHFPILLVSTAAHASQSWAAFILKIYATRAAMRRAGIEPYTRVGLCCGERCMKKRVRHEVALYLVSRSRYRCAGCFKLETGHNP